MEIGTISVFIVTMIGILEILTVKSYIIGVIAGKIVVINIEQEESSARVYTNNSNNSKSNSGRNSSIVVSVVIIVIIIM